MNSGGGGFYANADFPFAAKPIPGASADPCRLTFSSAQAPDVSDSAGDIVVELPSMGKPTTAKLTFDPKTKSYLPAELTASGQSARVEIANAPIHVRAAGAGVPAFDVTLLSAFDTTLIEPAEGAALPPDSGDLHVRWSDGGNEAVYATLLVDSAYLSCRFPPAAGQGTIPGALIAKAIASTDLSKCPSKCIFFQLVSLRTSKVASGNYDILVTHALSSGRALGAH